MKKHKPFKMQPLFRREKDLLSLVKSKDGLDKIKELAQITNSMQKTLDIAAKDLIEWQNKVCALLPNEFKQNTKFLTELSDLVARYEITNTEQGDNS